MKKLKVGAASLAAAALVISAGPASADSPQQYGCFTQRGSLLFAVDGSPGSAEWLADFEDCRAVSKIGTHVAPILP
jgi:hypothetical protein